MCGGLCWPLQNFELRITKFFTISKAAPELPFQLEDASRSDTCFEGKEEDEDVRVGCCGNCAVTTVVFCYRHAFCACAWTGDCCRCCVCARRCAQVHSCGPREAPGQPLD